MLQLSVVKFMRESLLSIEGTPNTGRFFIIQTGKVKCYRSNDTSGEGEKLLGTGDFVGVVACMSGHSQIETSMAVTDVTAISIKIEQYPDLIKNNGSVAMKIIKTFATRMRVMNSVLTQLTLSNVATETPEHIYDVARYYDLAGDASVAVFAYYQYLKACATGRHINAAKKRLVALKPKSHAVHFEVTSDLVKTYPKDTMIFAENQAGSQMFVIQEGSVKISKVVDDNEVTLARFSKTDIFGEMALLENKPRSANAIACEDCTLMVINRQNFEQIVKTQPGLIARLTRMLANRIWAMYRKFDNASLINPHHKLLDMLAIQIEQAMPYVASGVQLQTSFSLLDLATMCAIPSPMQGDAINDMMDDPRIRIVNGKVFVPNCLEVVKQAAFNRKQNKEKMQLAMGGQKQ